MHLAGKSSDDGLEFGLGHGTAFYQGAPAIMAAMGKGDKRTRRGKIYKGSYGKKRPHRDKKKKQAG